MNRRTLALAGILASLTMAAGGAGGPSPGDLDPSFGVGGKAFIGDAYFVIGGASVVQPDGKIVVTGGTTPVVFSANRDIVVARLNPDGSPDLMFGTEGVVRTPIDLVPDGVDEGAVAQVASDGKIIVGGWAEGETDRFQWTFVRYTPAGALDASFGNGGVVVLNLGGTDTWRNGAHDLAIQPDGRIVAVGETAPYWTALRLLPSGALDNSFGTGGVVQTLPGEYGNIAKGVALLPDGRIIATGIAEYFAEPTSRSTLIQYLPDGTLDPGFGNGGIVITSGGADKDSFDVVRLPDGRLLVAGTQYSLDVAASAFRLSRHIPNGDLDPSFGNGGVVVNYFQPGPAWAEPRSIVFQSDGRFVVGGYIDPENSVESFLLARYSENGALDTSFGDGGYRLYDLVPGRYRSDYGSNVLIQTVGSGPSSRERLVQTGTSYQADDSYAFSAIAVCEDAPCPPPAPPPPPPPPTPPPTTPPPPPPHAPPPPPPPPPHHCRRHHHHHHQGRRRLLLLLLLLHHHHRPAVSSRECSDYGSPRRSGSSGKGTAGSGGFAALAPGESAA
jgi:uncharacterized delta-60 repeat protein